MKKIILVGLLLVSFPVFCYVNGYYRRDGSYVNGYDRTPADNNPYNNYSSPSNINGYPNTQKPYRYYQY